MQYVQAGEVDVAAIHDIEGAWFGDQHVEQKQGADDREEHADVYIALRDAYEAARKQLSSYMDKLKDKNKGAAA